MTHTISSEPRFTAEDYLLYLRCPRSAHLRLTGELADPPSEFPVPSDRGEVLAVARGRASLPSSAEFNRSIPAAPYVAIADIWHPQRPQGFAAITVRDAASLKRAYLVEHAFIRYCAEAAGLELTKQFVHHLNKEYVRDGEIDAEAMFVAADVTRRVALLYPEQRTRMETLAGELAGDPTLELYRHRKCARPRACPVCGSDIPSVDDNHITTLYRGGDLVVKLQSEGFSTITGVPPERLVHPRQRIQRTSLETLEPHVDRHALVRFLESIEYPLHYLDFEAVNAAVPGYDGARPWEHVPYLFSVHSEESPGASLVHSSFLMRPPRDERRKLVDALLDAVSDRGSVLVYGAGFEGGVLARLARIYPERADEMSAVIGRIVDLLQPFSEFAFYDHRQRGKVSLKTVLPVLTEHDYSGLRVRDGYTANMAYRYLESVSTGDEFEQNPDLRTLGEHLVRYCTMDTLAMVRIMASLRELVEPATGDPAPGEP